MSENIKCICTTMYVFCIYPAMSKSPNHLPNCLKSAETSVVLIVCYGIHWEVRALPGSGIGKNYISVSDRMLKKIIHAMQFDCSNRSSARHKLFLYSTHLRILYLKELLATGLFISLLGHICSPLFLEDYHWIILYIYIGELWGWATLKTIKRNSKYVYFQQIWKGVNRKYVLRIFITPIAKCDRYHYCWLLNMT